MELTSQSVHAVYEGVQAPHVEIETACHGAQAVGMLNQDNMSPGMTPLEWSQAQSKDPALYQIIEAIQQKTIGKPKIKKCLQTLVFFRIRKQLKLKEGMLYRKSQVSNYSRTRLQLVLPIEYRHKAMAGCHDQIGHLGQDRVLELLRDRFCWPRMHMDIASFINSCPRCLRRKYQPDVAPLFNIEAMQPLELIHLDYLQIQPSKGNIENVLIVTYHFTMYAQAYLSKHCFSNS